MYRFVIISNVWFIILIECLGQSKSSHCDWMIAVNKARWMVEQLNIREWEMQYNIQHRTVFDVWCFHISAYHETAQSTVTLDKRKIPLEMFAEGSAAIKLSSL